MTSTPTLAQEIARRTLAKFTSGRAVENRPSLSYADFALKYLKILDKSKQVVPFAYNRAQRDLMATLTGRDLILKARQLGISTAVQGMQYQESVTDTATTMTLAHDDDATQKLRRIADRFHRHDPSAPQRGAANARLTTYSDHDSEVLIATAGNKTSGRASTLSHLHGSEVAFWPDAESIVAGAIQAGNPKVILESTPNGAQGYFYNLCMEALDGNSDWRLHFYPWWWDVEYQLPLDEGEALSYTDDEAELADAHGLTAEQIKWRRSKQRELKHLFIQEYPEDPLTCFLRSGYGYFGDVSGVFGADLDPAYDETQLYVAGLDFGQTVDYTVFTVVNVTTMQMVAMIRINNLPWSEMRSQVVKGCLHWQVKTLLPEANSMGTTNTEELRRELAAAKAPTRIEEFWTSNESKASIMSALNEALQSKALSLQNLPVLRHELGAFSAKQLPSGAWRLSAPDGEHDDTVISLALAWRAATSSPKSIKVGRQPAKLRDWRGG